MELGGYYSLSLTDLSIKENNIFSYLSGDVTSLYFDSGRSAIRSIARAICNDGLVLLPEYICKSVSDCFVNQRILYYKIKRDFSVDVDDLKGKVSNKVKAILLMHYFGAVQPDADLLEIRRIADSAHCIVIEDTTHSIFSRAFTIGDYQVCSIRKWMPIARGGVLYSQDDKLGLLNLDFDSFSNNDYVGGMILKDMFLNNLLSCNTTYRRIFEEGEKCLDSQNVILRISDLSRFLAACVDISEVVDRRKRNYKLLLDALANKGISPAIGIKSMDCPLVFPLRVSKRDELRQYLKSKRIYCAVHWPFDGIQRELRTMAEANGNELISIPIDQRYDKTHIDYLIEAILGYKGEILAKHNM